MSSRYMSLAYFCEKEEQRNNPFHSKAERENNKIEYELTVTRCQSLEVKKQAVLHRKK